MERHGVRDRERVTAPTWTGFRGGGGEVFAGHALQHPHEGCDEAVDVAGVMHAGGLQDHQGAKQLRRRPTRGSVKKQNIFKHKLVKWPKQHNKLCPPTVLFNKQRH